MRNPSSRSPAVWRHAPWIVAVLLAGCGQKDGNGFLQEGQLIGGGTKQVSGARPVGGFLPQPSLLAPGSSGQADLVYINPSTQFASYNNVIIDPVAIWTTTDSSLSSTTPDQRKALANKAHANLYNAIAKRCRMVQTASPGTLRMRFALVDAKATNATENTLATYTPYASTAYNLASLTFNNGVGYFAGTATGEGYATDARDGTLVWQAVDERGGTTSLAENTLNTWLDVDHAMQAWSEQVADRLQQLGACQRGHSRS